VEAARRQTLTESAAAQGGTRVLFYEKSTGLGLGHIRSDPPFGPVLRPTRWDSPLKKKDTKRKVGLTVRKVTKITYNLFISYCLTCFTKHKITNKNIILN